MMFEEGHPNVTLKDWQGFLSWHKSGKGFPPHLIDEVIDRNECACLPRSFVPLARGVAIAGAALLGQAGHRHGMYRPRGWRELSRDCYTLLIGGQGPLWPDLLEVRRCYKHEWWAIGRRIADVDETLVFRFGSTPIFTRTYQSAMRLAMHSHTNDRPNQLRWIKTSPTNVEAAIEMARNRELHEWFCAVKDQLH